MHAPMPQHYTLLDQRRIERVPRPLHLSPPYESIPGVTFSVNGWAGVRVKDILKDIVFIDAGNDTVLEHLGWRSTVVNLQVWIMASPLCLVSECSPIVARV